MSIKQRLARLEAMTEAPTSWQPPSIEIVVGQDEAETDRRLEAIRRQALAAGWRPESGRPYVIVALLPPADTAHTGGSTK